MHIKDVKPLFDILSHLSEREADIIRHRLIHVNRRGESSRVLELFNLVVFKKIGSDVRAAREMGYSKPGSAYANTKKRLLSEVLFELHQLEAITLRANEFPDDHVIIHQILSNAHLMWKRGQLEVAIHFFNEAYGLASINEDYFLLTTISHRLKVLSTYHSKTIGEFSNHAREAENATHNIMLINDLSTAYYQLRFGETFFSNRTDYEDFAQNRLAILRSLYRQADTASIKVQALNQMIQCHEVLGAHHGITAILKLILKLMELLPPHSLTVADAAIKQARYYLLKHDYQGASIALRTEELQKVIVSNRLFIYKEWLVIALLNGNEPTAANTELNKLKNLQNSQPNRGRLTDTTLLETLLKWHQGNIREALVLTDKADTKNLSIHQQLRRFMLTVAAAIADKNEAALEKNLHQIILLLNKSLLLNNPRNRTITAMVEILLKNKISVCAAYPEIQKHLEMLQQYSWHPLCDDAVAIDELVWKELNVVPKYQPDKIFSTEMLF